MFRQFYHGLIRRYVTVFGTMFNNMTVRRFNAAGAAVETIKVPITYAPRDRMLARVNADPNLNKPTAINLPVMGFEMVGMNYAPERKLGTVGPPVWSQNSSSGSVNSIYNPVPYDIQFRLSIYANRSEDAHQIVEQILPYFTPEWTNTMLLISEPEIIKDVPLVMMAITSDDSYEGALQDERRTIVWTLDFNMLAYFYGPSQNKSLIRFIDVRTSPSMAMPMGEHERVTIQPGLTANGQPTTDITMTIPYDQIDSQDDWDYIKIKEYVDE